MVVAVAVEATVAMVVMEDTQVAVAEATELTQELVQVVAATVVFPQALAVADMVLIIMGMVEIQQKKELLVSA